MSYSTRTEVRDMVKDDALNAIIGDTFIEDPAEREELVSPIIDAAIADDPNNRMRCGNAPRRH